MVNVTFLEIFDDLMFNILDRWRSTEDDLWFECFVDAEKRTHLDFILAAELPRELCEKFADEDWVGFDGAPLEAFEYEKNWRNLENDWGRKISKVREQSWENIVRLIDRDGLSKVGNVSAKEIEQNHNLESSCPYYSFKVGEWTYLASYRLVYKYAQYKEKIQKEEQRFIRASRQWSFIKDKFGFWIAAYAAVLSTILLVLRFISSGN